MKQYSFNQIQFRILAALFLFFTLTIVSYRVFIERPNIEKGLVKLAQRELSTLIFSANSVAKSFTRKVRDYAVWTAAYNFMADPDTSFIEENLNEDTFKTLEVDGMYFIDENMNTLAGRSFHYKNGHDIDLGFNDFEKFPINLKAFPTPTTRMGAPSKTGMIDTNQGIALFSAVQVRDSNQLGDFRGFVVFVKLIEQQMFDALSRYTMTKVSYQGINNEPLPEDAMPLDEQTEISDVKEFTHVYLLDLNNKPIMLMTIKHSNGHLPPVLELHSIFFILVLMVLVIVIYQILSSLIIHPVSSLANEIKELGDNGEVKYLDSSYPITELSNISKNFNALVDVVSQQTKQLAEQSYIDSLTQLTNRRGFEEHFQTHLQLCIRQKVSFVIIMADVDHFKKYNDLLGHVEGDHALIQIASVLHQHFQRTNDLCARYGGEEFIMFYNDMNKETLTTKLDEIIASFAKLNLAHPMSSTADFVTVSLGACMVFPEDISDHRLPFKSVVRKADFALYQAKNNGRNRAVICNYSDSHAPIFD